MNRGSRDRYDGKGVIELQLERRVLAHAPSANHGLLQATGQPESVPQNIRHAALPRKWQKWDSMAIASSANAAIARKNDVPQEKPSSCRPEYTKNVNSARTAVITKH